MIRNSYILLSSCDFLIGDYTRRVIAYVVFAKEYIIFTSNLKAKKPVDPKNSSGSIASPSTPTNIISYLYDYAFSTTNMNISSIDPTLQTYDVEDLDATETIDETTTGIGIIDVSSCENSSTRKYDGITGAMGSDGLMLMMMMHKKYDGEFFGVRNYR